MDTHEGVARKAVALLKKGACGSVALASQCECTPAFVDAALAPLVDAHKLVRLPVRRAGLVQFDYRWSVTFVPSESDFALCRGGAAAPMPSINLGALTPAPQPPAAPAAPPPVNDFAVKTSQQSREDGLRGRQARTQSDALNRFFADTPASNLGWGVAPSQQPDQHQAHIEEPAMPRKTTSKNAPPRLQICLALAAHGDMNCSELQAKVKVANVQAFHNGVYSAKQAGYLEKLDDGTYHLTESGCEWLAEQHPKNGPRGTGAAARPARKAAVPAAKPSVAPPIDLSAPRSFRCAVYSDGGFLLAKGESRIELDAGEHAQMLRYLERMAEQAA